MVRVNFAGYVELHRSGFSCFLLRTIKQANAVCPDAVIGMQKVHVGVDHLASAWVVQVRKNRADPVTDQFPIVPRGDNEQPSLLLNFAELLDSRIGIAADFLVEC